MKINYYHNLSPVECNGMSVPDGEVIVSGGGSPIIRFSDGTKISFGYTAFPSNCGLGVASGLYTYVVGKLSSDMYYEGMRLAMLAVMGSHAKVVFSDTLRRKNDKVSWWGFAKYTNSIRGTLVPNPVHENRTFIAVWEFDKQPPATVEQLAAVGYTTDPFLEELD